MALGGGKGRQLSDLLPRRFLHVLEGAGPGTVRKEQSPEEMKRIVRGWSKR